jgi:hypothetical protein
MQSCPRNRFPAAGFCFQYGPRLARGLLPTKGQLPMPINMIILQPAVALIAGLLILAIPRLLNVIVAVYLIVTGLFGLFPHLVR